MVNCSIYVKTIYIKILSQYNSNKESFQLQDSNFYLCSHPVVKIFLFDMLNKLPILILFFNHLNELPLATEEERRE